MDDDIRQGGVEVTFTGVQRGGEGDLPRGVTFSQGDGEGFWAK